MNNTIYFPLKDIFDNLLLYMSEFSTTQGSKAQIFSWMDNKVATVLFKSIIFVYECACGHVLCTSFFLLLIVISNFLLFLHNLYMHFFPFCLSQLFFTCSNVYLTCVMF